MYIYFIRVFYTLESTCTETLRAKILSAMKNLNER